MKIALAQINPTVGDFAGNTRLILDFKDRAADQGADLVVYPELCVCGYPPADLLEKASFLARAAEALEQLAAKTASGPAILCGTALAAGADGKPSEGKRARNVAALQGSANMPTLSSTNSGIALARAATTGRPQAMASRSTRPKVSFVPACTSASAEASDTASSRLSRR